MSVKKELSIIEEAKIDAPFYVRRCAELGLGVAFIPEISWAGQYCDSVVLEEVEGYERNTYIRTNQKKHKSKPVMRFIDVLFETVNLTR